MTVRNLPLWLFIDIGWWLPLTKERELRLPSFLLRKLHIYFALGNLCPLDGNNCWVFDTSRRGITRYKALTVGMPVALVNASGFRNTWQEEKGNDDFNTTDSVNVPGSRREPGSYGESR
jgi:hypothetical protein